MMCFIVGCVTTNLLFCQELLLTCGCDSFYSNSRDCFRLMRTRRDTVTDTYLSNKSSLIRTRISYVFRSTYLAHKKKYILTLEV